MKTGKKRISQNSFKKYFVKHGTRNLRRRGGERE
jgi:hypothetical protein